MIQHDFAFDPTYGCTLDELLAIDAPAAPCGFKDFWIFTYQKALQIPLRLTQKKIESAHPHFYLYQVHYDSWEGVRIGAWIAVPKSGLIEHGVVIGHGYGGREAPTLDQPIENAVFIFPCARGFHLSRHPEYPDNAQTHVVTGITSKESYVHRGCVVDYWLSASVLEQLYPQTKDQLYYLGASFGGGIGALMLPWDARFKKAYLDVPSFGNHPLRMTLPCVGSGHPVQNYYRRQPDVLDVLQYYDAATAAKQIRIPVFVAAARFDPAVPPPGQFCVYNSLAGPKKLFTRRVAHFECIEKEPDEASVCAQLRGWFA